jgi:hypothetical protein
MNDFLLISILVSIIINMFLFVFLYKKKNNILAKDGFVDSSVQEGAIAFTQAIETEINRVERYEDYSFTLVTLNFHHYPASLKDGLRSFVRKSDSIYVFDKKIYILFPFLHVDDAFEKKMYGKLVEYIKLNHDEASLKNIELQECNIHDMICLEHLVKGADE